MHPGGDGSRKAPGAGEPTDGGTGSVAHDTRTRILVTARRMFAEKGYAAATVRAITEEADVNVAAVNYHFGGKLQLYHAVLEEVIRPLQAEVLEVSGSARPTRERLESLIRSVFEHLWDNPDQAHFMVEMRLRMEEWPSEVMETLAPITGAFIGVVEDGQAEGLVDEGDPLLYVISLLSQPVYFMITMRRAPAGSFAVDPQSPSGREAFVDHMVRFALKGLAAGQPSGTPSGDPGGAS